jgi:hypothetical protein
MQAFQRSSDSGSLTAHEFRARFVTARMRRAIRKET